MLQLSLESINKDIENLQETLIKCDKEFDNHLTQVEIIKEALRSQLHYCGQALDSFGADYVNSQEFADSLDDIVFCEEDIRDDETELLNELDCLDVVRDIQHDIVHLYTYLMEDKLNLLERYVTVDDYLEQALKPALGEFVDDYDLDYIVDNVLVFNDKHFYLKVDIDEFWDVVKRGDKGGKV